MMSNHTLACISVRNRCRLFWPGAGLALLVSLASPPVVLAHEGRPPAPHDLWSSWSWDPFVLAGLALAAWGYARGVRALWGRAGIGRGVRRWQAIAFASGLAALFVALVSPLDALGSALFSAHMVQHLLLVLVAAPLLVVGGAPVLFLWALPLRWRRPVGGWWKGAVRLRAVWRLLSWPLVAWGLHAAVMWIWHAPLLYQAALRNELVHALEHAGFFGSALLFWWVVLQPGGRRRLRYGASVLYLFTTALHSSALGALITFAPTPWYPAYSDSVRAWNLTLLEDQQLAGVVMWVPAGLVYVVVASALFIAWMQAMEQRDLRIEGAYRRRGPAPESVRLGGVRDDSAVTGQG